MTILAGVNWIPHYHHLVENVPETSSCWMAWMALEDGITNVGPRVGASRSQPNTSIGVAAVANPVQIRDLASASSTHEA